MFFEHTGAENLDLIHKEVELTFITGITLKKSRNLKKNYTSVDCKNFKIESYKEYTK